jgi:hypothetical protein
MGVRSKLQAFMRQCVVKGKGHVQFKWARTLWRWRGDVHGRVFGWRAAAGARSWGGSRQHCASREDSRMHVRKGCVGMEIASEHRLMRK